MDALPAFVLGAATASFVWSVTLLTSGYVSTLRAVKREAREAVETRTPMTLQAFYDALTVEGYSVDSQGGIRFGELHTRTWFDTEVAFSKTVEEAMYRVVKKHKDAVAMYEAQLFIQSINTPQQ